MIGSFFTKAKNKYARAFAEQGKAINNKVRLYATVGAAETTAPDQHAFIICLLMCGVEHTASPKSCNVKESPPVLPIHQIRPAYSVQGLPEASAVLDGGKMSEPRNQHHVFVVDDEPIIASTLAMILRGQGFDVRSFIEPLAALEAMLSQPPDLLLTDVMMPSLSGIELAIRVREYSPHCNVLLFSGYSVAADLHEAALAQGQVFEFLSKPAHPRDVLTKIREMFERVPPQTLVAQPKQDCRPSPACHTNETQVN